MTDGSGGRRRARVAVALATLAAAAACLGLGLWARRLYQGNLVDDAAISLVYAERWSTGQGLVFNVGERVEGYTNVAWVAFGALGHRLAPLFHADWVEAVLRANVGLAALAALLVGALGWRAWPGRIAPTLLALALLVIDDSFTTWAALGLEGHLQACAFLGALLFASDPRGPRPLGLAAALLLATLCRPDAAPFGGVLLFTLGLAAWRSGAARPRRLRALALAGGLWVAAYGAYWAARASYYGAFFPNTYTLKVAGDLDAWARGADYLREFARNRAWVPLLAPLGLFGAVAARAPWLAALALYLPLHALWVARVGGDFFAGSRLMVADLPLHALAVAAAVDGLAGPALRRLRAARGGRWIAGAAAGALVAGVLGALHVYRLRVFAEGPLLREVLAWRGDLTTSRRLMDWLRARETTADPARRFEPRGPGRSIATGLIGYAGLWSGLRVVDLYGVIDPAVAAKRVPGFGKGKAGHEKSATPEEVLARRPSYVVPGYFFLDLWQRGYTLEPLPPGVGRGFLWVEDTLPATHVPVGVAFDFDGPTTGWAAEGPAFAAWPTRARPPGHELALGASGAFVTSWVPGPGDAAQGRLLSPAFTVEGELITLRVGGGDDPDRLRVALIADGEVLRVASGLPIPGLRRVVWDTAALRGRAVFLEILDESTAPRGSLIVDEIRQWKRH